MSITAAPTITVEVINGPNLERILDALKYAFDPNEDLRKQIKPGFVLEYEDENSWMYTPPRKYRRPVSVDITGIKYHRSSPNVFVLTMNILGGVYEALYDVRTHRGTIDLDTIGYLALVDDTLTG